MRDTRALIRSAFAKAPKPENLRDIAPHECWECDRISQNLMPHTFESIPRNVLEYHSDSLPLLGPAGLRYYLPAYLLYALDHPASDIMMFTVFHLTPKNEAQGYFEERFGLFSEAQKQAVAAFLEDVMNYQYYTPHEQEFERAMELWPMRPDPSVQPTPASRRE